MSGCCENENSAYRLSTLAVKFNILLKITCMYGEEKYIDLIWKRTTFSLLNIYRWKEMVEAKEIVQLVEKFSEEAG